MITRIAQVGNVIWGQLAVAVAALAGIRLYTEILGPSHYGAAMLVLGAIALFDSVGVLALNQTLISRCGPHVDNERRRQLSVGLSWHFFKWFAFLGVVVGLVVAIAATWVTADMAWLLLPAIILLYIAAETAKISLLSLIVLDRRYALYSSWMAAESFLSVLGVVACLMVWRADALGFLVGYVLSHALCAVVFIRCASPGHLRAFHLVRTKDEIGPAMSYGVPVALMGPLGWVSTYLDRYILGAVLGTSATGVYVAVLGLVARPYSLTTAVLTNYFRPLYFQPDVVRGGRQDYFRILRHWVLSALCVGLSGTAILGLVGEWIARMALAPDFRDGAPGLMVIFSLAQTFTIMTHAVDNAVLATGNSRRLLQVQAFLSIATLVLIPLGVAAGGVMGGVIGRSIAEAIKFVVVMVLAMSLISRSEAASSTMVEKREGAPS